MSAQVTKNETVGEWVGWLEVGVRWQRWSSSCLLVPMCPWEPLAAKRLKAKASLSQRR